MGIDKTKAQAGSLCDDVFEILLKRIVRGELKPDSRIVESVLAKEMNVSRTPLREALFRLEQDGFIRSEINRGFFVQGLSAREAREVYPVLWMLEAQALELCGGLAFTNTEELEELNERFGKAKSNSFGAQAADMQFHKTLVSQCPNKYLLQLIDKSRRIVNRYESAFMLNAALVRESVKHHEAIIKALKQRDVTTAKEKLIFNWSSGLKNMLLIIGEM